MQSFTSSQAEKAAFLGRHDFMDKIREQVKKKKHSIIIAPPGYGKNSLLRQLFSKTLTAHLDLRLASISPELMALEILASILGTDPDISELVKQPMDDDCRKVIDRIDNELQKIKPNQQSLITDAISFINAYHRYSKKDFVVVWEHFEEFLQLDNYSQIKDIRRIFSDSIRGSAAPFIITADSELKIEGVDAFRLNQFSKETASEVAERLLGKTDDRLKAELLSLSAGIPFVLKELCLAYGPRREKGDVQKEIQNLRSIFEEQLSTPSTPIYNYCDRLYTTSLDRARGTSLLKILMKTLCRDDDLKLSEIARRIYRSAPVTKSLLERLIEVDLITKQGSIFNIRNPVLKAWCRLRFWRWRQ